MLKRIRLTDLKPGDMFGYSFVEDGRRRYCIGVCARVEKERTLFVSRARCVGPLEEEPTADQWSDYSSPAQSGFTDLPSDEVWELYAYDEDALWAAHCAEQLTNG
jgi:hypothetical protein